MKYKLSVAIVFMICGCATASADDSKSFSIPPQEVKEGTPKILNGYPVGGAKWPATRISNTTTAAGTFQCTATVIGPQVVLTAAHCVDDKATMDVLTSNGRISVVCDHHNSYSGNPWHENDIALCISSQNISLAGSRYERINTASSFPKKAAEVRIIGFGCTSPGGEPSPYLYTGTTKVENKESNRITLSGGGGAVVCEGDSGGAAYVEGPEDPEPLTRVIIGVNSTREADFSASNITDLSAPQIANFIKTWKSKHGVTICGYDAPSTSCHP